MSIEYNNPLVISPDPFLTNGQLRAEAVVVEGTMALARSVHDDGYVDFLENAWMKWVALEHKDPHFFGKV